MGEDKVGFKFTWTKGMPQRNEMYLFRYIDGEEYEIDDTGHVIGKFALFDDIHAHFPVDQRLSLIKPDIEELRKFLVRWEKIL